MTIIRILIFSLLFITISCNLFAQQSRFDEANDLLEENLYSEAVQIYQSIADDGYESGALWLNMGIAYSQMDSLGIAKYYLLKAKNHRETASLADEALNYVNERFSRRSAVLPPLPWVRFFNFLSESIGVTAIAITALIFFYLAIACLIGSWFRYDFNKQLRTSFYTFFTGAIILFLFSWIIHYQEERFDTAVMVDRQSTVYQQPRDDSAVITTAFEGYLLRIDNHQAEPDTEWYYIRLENGMNGWVRKNGVKVL